MLPRRYTTEKYSLNLTHWGRGTHICGSKLTIIGSDNGLSPGRRQAIIWTNARILLIRLLGTNFNEMSIEILTFSFTKMRLKVSSVKLRPFCLGLNVLSDPYRGHQSQMSAKLLPSMSFPLTLCITSNAHGFNQKSGKLPKVGFGVGAYT